MIKELRDSAEVAKKIEAMLEAEYLIAKGERIVAENRYSLYLAKIELTRKTEEIEKDKNSGN
jgi:hypothetical protein